MTLGEFISANTIGNSISFLQLENLLTAEVNNYELLTSGMVNSYSIVLKASDNRVDLSAVPGLEGFNIFIESIGYILIVVSTDPEIPNSISFGSGKMGIGLPKHLLPPVKRTYDLNATKINELKSWAQQNRSNDSQLMSILNSLDSSPIKNTTYDSKKSFVEAVLGIISQAEYDSYSQLLLSRLNDWVIEKDSSGNVLQRDILIDFELEISVDQHLNFVFDWPLIEGRTPRIIVEPVMIDNSGVVIEFENLYAQFTGDDKFIAFDKVAVYFPDYLPAVPNLSFLDCKINRKGFSGIVDTEWDLALVNNEFTGELAGSIYGFSGGIRKAQISFEENVPTNFLVEGGLFIPYFEAAVDIRMHVGANGKFLVELNSAGGDGIELSREDLLKLRITALAVGGSDGIFNIAISGGIEPLLFAKDGVQWPRMDVKDLQISSDGKISIKEAWMDLKDMVNVDLWGFHFELRKIGVGTTHDHKMWVDISGGVKLVEQLPLGLDVEGFRIAWPDDLKFDDPSQLVQKLQKIEVQFAGVEINFAIPAVVKIDGLIRFIKEAQKVAFAGDMKLAVIPAGFTAEAGMLVGMNFEEPAYPFLYVYFGFEAAAGIPLGQTGLALKGAIGLIGMNVAPDKTPEQNWFYDWYKRDPGPGVQHTTKWTDKRNAFAIGVGVTISTTDGVVKSTKGLLVLAVPGPILVIEGKAILLNPSGEGEGPFGAIAVFDGNEATVQFNVEAQAELVKDMVDAHAGVEAFFDFKDLSNWHLYLGQDEPQDRRIQANIMDIIKADAFLMLDMLDADTPQMRMGVSAKIEPPIPDLTITIAGIDVGIKIEAWLKLAGHGYVSINPEQFSGGLDIDGKLSIDALGVHFSISGYVHSSFEGPVPFKLKGELGYELDLPWPCPDYSDTAEFELKYPGDPVLDMNEPAATVSLFSRFKSESKSALLKSNPSSTDRELAEASPFVDIDVNPVIGFEQQMNDPPGVDFLRHPDGTKRFAVGRIDFEPNIVSIRIFEKRKNEDWGTGFGDLSDNNNPCLIYYSNSSNPQKKLRGVWITESDVQSPALPATRKLQLLTENPLINTTHSLSMEAFPFLFGGASDKHLSKLLLEDYPGLFFEEPEKPKDHCIDFVTADKARKLTSVRQIPANQVLEFGGLKFRSNEEMYLGGLQEKDVICFGLYAVGTLEILFPEDIASCTINYCTIENPENLGTDKDLVTIRRLRKGRAPKPKSSIRYTVHDVKNKKDKIVAEYEGDPGTNSLWSKFPASKRKHFQKIEMRFGMLIIEQICYITQSSLDKYDKEEEIGDRNEQLTLQGMGDRISPVINPGCYYLVLVETELKGNTSHEPSTRALKRAFNDNTSKAYTKKAFFQTNAPPCNIGAYTKWTYPNLEQNRIPTSAKMAICFKRDYLRTVFDGNADQLHNFKITAVILDAENNLSKINTQWQNAGAFTLYPDEETWESYKVSKGLPQTNRKENILKLDSPSPLRPNQKYNLLLTGGDGGEIFIPTALDISMIEKHWLPGTAWSYNGNKFSLTGIGTKMMLSSKDSFSNVEVSFEVRKSQPFGIIFRYKKTSDNREVYYKISFIRRGGAGLDILDFRLTDGIHSVNKSRVLLINEFWPLEWRKFKIRIIGNRVHVFCFDKNLLPADPEGFDLNSLVPPESAGYVVENNINGRVGIFASQTNIQFRNVQVRSSELMRIPFYTTGFESFSSMVSGESGSSTFNTVSPSAQISDQVFTNFNQQYVILAQARLKLYKSIVDNEYGMAQYTEQSPALTGREAVEKYRLEARASEKLLDDLFHPVALAQIGGTYFDTPKTGIEITGIRSGNNLIALFIKSPEKLLPLVSGVKDPYARLSVSVKHSNVEQKTGMLFNGDGTHLIVKITPLPIESTKKLVVIRFTNINDFKDDSPASTFFESGQVKHHRYDRPFSRRGQDSEVAEVTIQV